MKFGLTLILSFLFSAIFAQTPVQDLVTTDITKLSDFDGNKISFFGLKKEMTRQEAIDKLNSLKQFVWEYDLFNTKSENPNTTGETRIYVNLIDDNNREEKLSLLYLIWDEGAVGMSSIVFYKDAGRYMTGENKKLFTPEALIPGNPLTRFLRGTPKKTEGITTNWAYPDQHFIFIKYKDTKGEEKTWFKFAD